MTCTVENEGSRRTILSCGGVCENTVYYKKADDTLERYYITLQTNENKISIPSKSLGFLLWDGERYEKINIVAFVIDI